MKKGVLILIAILLLAFQLSGCSPKPAPLSINFESPYMSGIGLYAGTWKVVDDGTGNHVFEQQDPTIQDWPGFVVGGIIENGVIQFRFKYLSYENFDGSGRVNLSFRQTKDVGGYVLSFNPYINRNTINYVGKDGVWSDFLPGSESMVTFTKDTWYNVRVELKGQSIKVYLNDNLLTSITDNKFKSGTISIGLGPQTTAQIDDISIVYQ